MKTAALKYVLVTLVAVLFAGCTGVGNVKTGEVDNYLKLEKNITTKKDVYVLFGQPARVNYPTGQPGSTWQYLYAKVSVDPVSVVPIVGLFAGGTNADTKVATFYFDEDDRFINVESVSAKRHVGHIAGISAPAGSLYQQYADGVRKEMFKYNVPFDEKAAKEFRGIEVYVDPKE